MTQKIPQSVIDLYDSFTHGGIGRREFLARLAVLAGGAAGVSALLPLLTNDYARAMTVEEGDPRIETGTVEFDTSEVEDPPESGSRSISAYHVRPVAESIAPAIIVIHENRGLNAHIKDVARRFALEGFHAFAVDMLTPFGGAPKDENAARELVGALDRDRTAMKLALIVEQLALLKTHQRKVGTVGFCWGGGMVNALAAASPHLRAGVVYYGMQARAEEAARIKAALLFHYAGEDARINAGIEDYEVALAQAGVDFQTYLYEGAQHAFNNDTNAARYDKAAADLAWRRTIEFFRVKFG